MKESYEVLEMKVITFEVEDVITASDDPIIEGGDDD